MKPSDITDLQFELNKAAADVREVNVKNGWYDDTRTFGDDIALLHSECSEMLEAFRSWQTDDATLAECDRKRGVNDVLGASGYHDSPDHLCKPEGIGSEAADILVRLLDTCDRYDINLGAEFERKLAYNRTRSYRHGGRAL